jgi:hypothetical protein
MKQFVIPAQAGIQEFLTVAKPLDTRFRGYDIVLKVSWLRNRFYPVYPAHP